MKIHSAKYDSYLRFFKLIIKYWNSAIFMTSDDEIPSLETEKTKFDHAPEELVEDLKEMGPTYIKLGQLLSTRPDMLPKAYLEALSTLQDEVDSVAYEEVEEIFREEIGVRISKAFKRFEKEPMASASIGQVHEAELHSGEKVAVKIQRPGIRKRFVEDLDVLMELSEKAETFSEKSRYFSLNDVVEELRYILLQELDYREEAKNLKILKENLAEFKHIYVPGTIADYCSGRVLTMEFIEGQKATSLSPFQMDGMPKKEMVDEFVKAYLRQVIVDGFAHADPHPGNVHIMKTGKIALMDLGMVARFDETMRNNILKLMIALGANNGMQVTQVLLDMSETDKDRTDIPRFKKLIIRKVQENQNQQAQDLQTGKIVMEINKIAIQQGVKLPLEFVSLGKILLNLDQIIAVLDPTYELQKAVKSYVEHLLRTQSWNQLKSGDFLQSLMESKELMENLPYRLNRITEDLVEQRFKIKMDVFDQRKFLVAFQKVANRITTGLVVASLILGAAIVMHIPTDFNLMGYPGFAVLLFICAAFFGMYLVYQILFKDESDLD